MNISITLWVLYFTFLILFLIFIILFFNKLRLTLNNKKSYFVVLGSIILFILLYTFLVGTLFPQQLISEEGRTAIETHYIGVLFGLFTSYFLISLSENHRFKWLKCWYDFNKENPNRQNELNFLFLLLLRPFLSRGQENFNYF